MPQERMVIAQRRDTAALVSDSGGPRRGCPMSCSLSRCSGFDFWGSSLGTLDAWPLHRHRGGAAYPGRPMSMRAVSLEVTGIAAAALVVWQYVRYCGYSLQTKTNVSLGHLVFNGMGVAVLNTWIFPPVQAQAIHLSWVTVGILVFSMISPASPRSKPLTTALVTASMDPLALLIAYVSGAPVASLPRRRRALAAELRVRDDRGAALEGAAARRTPAPRSAGAAL